jgi:carboxyl-terminal processing protease
MSRRTRLWMPVLGALVLGLVLGGWMSERVSARRDTYTYLDLFNDSLAKIEATYVEDVDIKDLMYGAIRGMLSTLDPYSVFFDEDSFEKFRVTTEGEFGGLGIQITVRDGILTVVSPIEGTPAYDLGIRSGDRIVQIEGESTRGITVDGAIDKLRGEPGTKVDITILREGLEDLLDYTVTRDIIKIDSVPYAFMLNDRIGYVRVSRFARTTADELNAKLDELDSQGMQELIIDLRSNPGGLLSQAVDVSDIFLDTGELVVSTKGRIDEQNQSYYARTPARFDREFPIVVLINGGSASASEILAGSIQDWDRGIVAGTTSFGKGSVQTLMRLRPLTKDCAMKITTAKWYVASGRAIEKPEHWMGEDETAAAEADTADQEAEKPEYRTAGGRIVYGGGGVTPDVTIEPTRIPDIVVDLERREEFFEFAIDYVAKNGPPKDFEVTDQVWNDFVDFLSKDEFEFDLAGLEEHRDEIELSIRRDMARHVSGREAAYEIALRADHQLNRTVEILGKAEILDDLFREAEQYTDEQLGMK